MAKRFADNPRILAQARGDRTYPGLPCRRGHDGERYTNSQKCIYCSRASTITARAARDRKRSAEAIERAHVRSVEVVQSLAEMTPDKPSNPVPGNGWPFGECFASENYHMKPLPTVIAMVAPV